MVRRTVTESARDSARMPNARILEAKQRVKESATMDVMVSVRVMLMCV